MIEPIRSDPEIGSLISVPLYHRSDSVGVLTVCHDEPDHFQPGDRRHWSC
ncbi:MAG TPA: GAF domain-containing protein [Solirubrobacterales bacterium]